MKNIEKKNYTANVEIDTTDISGSGSGAPQRKERNLWWIPTVALAGLAAIILTIALI